MRFALRLTRGWKEQDWAVLFVCLAVLSAAGLITTCAFSDITGPVTLLQILVAGGFLLLLVSCMGFAEDCISHALRT